MGNEVYANGREISCKAGERQVICRSRRLLHARRNPAHPPGVPIPYPNTGMDSDTTSGSKTVQIGGQEVMLKNNSCFQKSTRRRSRRCGK